MRSKLRSTALAFLLAGAALPATAQVKVGDNPTTLTPSAVLEASSTTQGFLLPRMMQAQMNAIVAPATGLMVYCLNCTPAGLRIYDGSAWTSVGANNNPSATFTSGTLSCTGALSGTYQQGVATTSSNTKQITVTSNSGGNYTATTNTANGVTFAATGTLFSTGAGTPITLTASGTPTASGAFSYTASLGGQTCTFSVTYSGPATFACGNATNTFTPTGSLVNGTSYSGSYTLPYTAGNGSSYSATTLTQNGLNLTRPAGMLASGGGNVVYTLSGTYTGSAASETFNIAEGCAVGVPSNYVFTLAGSTAGFANGNGTAAQFNTPTGVAVDASGNVYVADRFNNRIRKIDPSGNVTTLAGSTSGSANGNGTAAQFNSPNGIAVDANGNVYVAEQNNNRIRKIDPSGNVTTLAGSTAGFANGNGTAAQFNNPSGVAVDASGNVYVADRFNNRIRKIDPSGNVTTLAGSGTAGFANGNGTAAQFKGPLGVAVDASGNVYVADAENHQIRKIDPSGNVTALAGSGTTGSANGNGTAAQFNAPRGVAVDASGNVYVGDGFNHQIRKIDPSGNVTTLAGSGTAGFANGNGTAAQFNSPFGVAVDASGNVYVADLNNNRIRKITP